MWRNSVRADKPGGNQTFNGSSVSTNFAYAAGVSINQVENLSLNVGYEGSRPEYWNTTYSINSFSVGYRF